jgi:hypothetical protein
VTVQWQNNKNKLHDETFDKVVLTTDMWMNSALLQNDKNKWLWDSLYEKYVGYGLKYEGKYSPSGKDWKNPPLRKIQRDPGLGSHVGYVLYPFGFIHALARSDGSKGNPAIQCLLFPRATPMEIMT